MPVQTDLPDLERALHLLVHDVRAPLSVAHGYLRLIREQRLPSEAERDRALAQAAESLSRISQLCDEALAYAAMKTTTAAPLTAMAAGDLVGDLRRRLEAGPEVDEGPLPAEAVLRVADPARLVEALGTVVLAVWQRLRRRPDALVRATVAATELVLVIGRRDEWDALHTGPHDAFDPWKGGHGLALPRACATVARAGGRLWGLTGSHATGIALPLEMES